MGESLSDMIIKGLMISILALVVAREVFEDRKLSVPSPVVQPDKKDDEKPKRKKWHPFRPWLNEEEEIQGGERTI